MAMPWNMALWMVKMVWMALSGLVSSCLMVADDIAGSLRTGDVECFIGDGVHDIASKPFLFYMSEVQVGSHALSPINLQRLEEQVLADWI
ncbi:hypothetical protein HHK36_019607 [Tetracentron sinense]|uniref:Uncharacterized protein n=1 Tax=Tetracentron sinense TaxID=13715 RepID=A0A835DCF6_TETSI|nr:hypothetical protein HHK36_019607 [Tetracentron sinense]